MIPVAKTQGKTLSFEELCNEIIDSAKTATVNNRVLAHAILLYNSRHSALIKLLKDEDHYRALDVMSGRYLNIYHAIPKSTKSSIKNLDNYCFDGDKKKQMLGFMNSAKVSIIDDEPLYSSIIDKFREKFNIHNNINNPVLLFFSSINVDITEDFYTIILKGKTPYEILDDLKQIIESVEETLEHVDDNYIENQNDHLFRIMQSLKNYNFKRYTRDVSDSTIFKFLSFLKP